MNNSKEDSKLINRENAILSVGIIIAMIIVWLTINVPINKQDRAINKQCYKVCKSMIEDWETRSSLMPRARYLIKLRDCMQECRLETGK